MRTITHWINMKYLLSLLIGGALAPSLFATVVMLDDQGKPLKESLDVPALRVAPEAIRQTTYGKRIIRLSEPERNQVRAIYSAEEGKTNYYTRLDGALEELGRSLTSICGKPFMVVTQDPGEGIVIARSDAAGLTIPGLGVLKSSGAESFLIQSDGARKLYLVGNSDLALQHAVYTYLDMLGCRWYFPGDNWTVFPTLTGVGVKINALCSPAFSSRGFFGTEGVLSLTHLYDRDAKAAYRWITWTDRNRFGGLTTGGHYYQDFIARNKAFFEAHPECRPEIKGKRVPVSEGMKLCYSNPEVIDLFVKDRVEACKAILVRDAPKGIFSVSVEPSDGGGHCECAACVKLGSITDRVFSLANQVARAVRAVSPFAYVNLYAYNEHSPPPSIQLEPNVMVQVAAYGFNQSGLPADKLIMAWGSKSRYLGVYDYWCIPQWGNDTPYLDFDYSYPARVKFWYDNNVRSFTLESSYSGGAVGPALYMVSRLSWEPHQDPQALFDDFYEKAFGSARPAMERLLTRWGNGFKLTEAELADSFQDIEEALYLTSDPAVKRRIHDYLGYVEYLRLRYEFLMTDRVKDRENWIARCRELCHHLYRIHHSCMNHTVVTCGQYFWGTSGIDRPLSEEQLDVPVKRSSEPLSEPELAKILETGRRTYVPRPYDKMSYATDYYVPLHPVTSLVATTRATPILIGDHSHKLSLYVYVPLHTPELTLSIRFLNPPPEWDNFTMAMTQPWVNLVSAKVPFDPKDPTRWYDYKIPLPKGFTNGFCLIRLLNVWGGVEMKYPANLPVGMETGFLRIRSADEARSDPQKAYFFVPAGLKTAAYSYPHPELLDARDPVGNMITKDVSKGTVLFKVNNGDQPSIRELCFPSINFQEKTTKPLPVPLNMSPMMSFCSDNILVPRTVSAAK